MYAVPSQQLRWSSFWHYPNPSKILQNILSYISGYFYVTIIIFTIIHHLVTQKQCDFFFFFLHNLKLTFTRSILPFSIKGITEYSFTYLQLLLRDHHHYYHHPPSSKIEIMRCFDFLTQHILKGPFTIFKIGISRNTCMFISNPFTSYQ